jgi:1-acyl-sn-glycerol-3-phosphate acyltransferase
MRRGPGAARSILGFLALMLLFGAGGLVQRLVLWPLVLLLPDRRPALVTAGMKAMSASIVRIVGLAGGRISLRGGVPTHGPVLLLANHQSVLDIPLVVLLSHPLAPVFVTRRRYARGIPFVSLCVRLLGCPVIEPGRQGAALRILRRTAARHGNGILIFPEGHRSRDGGVSPFKVAGIKAMLRAGPRKVYLVVTDGLWRCRRLWDFAFGMHTLRGEVEVLGPFSPPSGDEETTAFVERMREVMIDRLRERREGRAH